MRLPQTGRSAGGGADSSLADMAILVDACR